jgi:DNA-binding HxlR family transcriptional regulator
MALPHDYSGQVCSLSRTLEVVGERWTLLIVRDAFYGVRRFSDFVAHLSIPRAVLTDRLKSLTEAGVLVRAAGSGRREEYQLTPKGVALWPAVRTLMAWGDEYYAPTGPRREFRHAADNALIDATGHCTRCDAFVEVADTVVAPGPGLADVTADDPVTTALADARPLLQPLRAP